MTSCDSFKVFSLHFSLFLAGGLGVANAMLVKNLSKAEVPPALPVQKTMMTPGETWACCTRCFVDNRNTR